MTETWHTDTCPHCQAKNWWNEGDTNDLTVPDTEALRCWSCRQRFFIDEESVRECREQEIAELCQDKDDMVFNFIDLDDYLRNGAFCEWGRRSPDDPYKSMSEE